MLNIKEIALKVADSLRNKIDGISHMQSNQGLVAFAEALIASYKAELLKEVGEPVAEIRSRDIGYASEENYAVLLNPVAEGAKLFTESQLLAARKGLEEEVEQLRSQNNDFTELDKQLEAEVGMDLTSMPNAINELRTQLAAAQEEINLLKAAVAHEADVADSYKDQLAKAEQRVAEWQPIETAPKTGAHLAIDIPNDCGRRPYVIVWLDADHPDADGAGWYEHWNFDPVNPTHWLPLPEAPKGEEK